MLRNEMIAAVRIRIDELTPFSDSDVSIGNEVLVKPVSRYIDDCLNEATDSVRFLAPSIRMTPKNLPAATPQPLGDSDMVYYRIPIPSDFLKIVEVKMSDWKRSCYGAVSVSDDNDLYKIVENPYTTPGVSKPVALITSEHIKLYGSRATGATSTGRYIGREHYTDSSGPSQHPLVDYAIMWRSALLVLGIMGRNEVVKQAEAFYAEALKQM